MRSQLQGAPVTGRRGRDEEREIDVVGKAARARASLRRAEEARRPKLPRCLLKLLNWCGRRRLHLLPERLPILASKITVATITKLLAGMRKNLITEGERRSNR